MASSERRIWQLSTSSSLIWGMDQCRAKRRWAVKQKTSQPMSHPGRGKESSAGGLRGRGRGGQGGAGQGGSRQESSAVGLRVRGRVGQSGSEQWASRQHSSTGRFRV